MYRTNLIILSLVALIVTSQKALAWSQAGHHLVAQMAYGKLDKATQLRLIEILKKHPRFDQDFKKPSNIKDDEYNEWLIGRAAFWPDIARNTEYDRPNWHYELGSYLTIGNADNFKITRDSPWKAANLQNREVHIEQAFDTCLEYFQPGNTDADRAVALCWILHLVGDAHQPCHSGALYQSPLFPKGDKGGNLIPTVQSENMHALWDHLLGPRYDKGDIRRRISEIESSKTELAKAVPLPVDTKNLDIDNWIQESRKLAKQYVCTKEVLDWLKESSSKSAHPQPLKLSGDYLKHAGKVAQIRAYQASERLVELLKNTK